MEDTPKPSTAADKRRWSALRTLVTSWLMPARTARRTALVSLKAAYFVHLLATVLAVMLIVVLIAWAETHSPVTLRRVLYRVQWIPYKLMDQFEESPNWFVLARLGVALAIELGFVALAFIIMSWGARDEPVRASFRHALTRTWLQTAHVLPIILLVGVLTVTLTHARRNWNPTNPWPQWPQPPANAPPGSHARKDYEEAIRTYEEQVEKWREARPWYVEHMQPIIANAVILAGAWLLWALFRSVGAPRLVPPMVRPATCEACGYNLTTIPMDSRCPECGQAVVLSLGPSVRSGTLWEHTHKVDRWGAWSLSSSEAVWSAATLGRKLRASPPGAAYRGLWTLNLALVFLLAPLAVIAIMLLESRAFRPSALREFILIVGFMVPILGFLAATGLLFLALLAASVVGFAAGFHQKRNLMPYSMQMVSYLGGFFVVWVAFAGALGVGVYLMYDGHWFDALERLVGIDDGLLAFLTWFVPNCVLGIWYLVLVARGTAASRYANR